VDHGEPRRIAHHHADPVAGSQSLRAQKLGYPVRSVIKLAVSQRFACIGYHQRKLIGLGSGVKRRMVAGHRFCHSRQSGQL
jgi:hypothetical protein